jgi:hypothetical protein
VSRYTYIVAFMPVPVGERVALSFVTREDARGLYPDPSSLNAVDVVLEQRGWMRGEIEGLLFCPNCIGGVTAN